MNIIRFKVKNFGPITSGYDANSDDGFMDIPKVTVFCGPQGSGKSTLTKVLSSLAWIEKAAQFVGWNRPEIILEEDRIIKNLLQWHGLSTYFKSSTEISYRGSYLSLDYVRGQLRVWSNPSETYAKPKIMYVPAERNMIHLLSPDVIGKMLPKPLATLFAEFKLARENVVARPFPLPVNGYRYIYDDSRKDYYIENAHAQGESSLTPVSEASSGLQSVLPLLLVTDYLSGNLGVDVKSDGVSMVLTSNPFISLGVDGKTLFQIGSDERIDFGSILRGTLTGVDSFTNIVEEPEQNLFPPTQRNVLRHLLGVARAKEGNRLIVSTHSPYIIEDLIAAIRAQSVGDKLKGVVSQRAEMIGRLEKCYPAACRIAIADVALYETSFDGTICKGDDDSGVIPDSNFLNRHLVLGSKLLDELANIEESAGCKS